MTSYSWRGAFTNEEINALHAEAFDTCVFTSDEWDWQAIVRDHSLGWVVARDDEVLVGFVNVIWDGFVHAWLQDTMVSETAGRRGIGTQLVGAARDAARSALDSVTAGLNSPSHAGPGYPADLPSCTPKPHAGPGRWEES